LLVRSINCLTLLIVECGLHSDYRDYHCNKGYMRRMFVGMWTVLWFKELILSELLGASAALLTSIILPSVLRDKALKGLATLSLTLMCTTSAFSHFIGWLWCRDRLLGIFRKHRTIVYTCITNRVLLLYILCVVVLGLISYKVDNKFDISLRKEFSKDF
jgi:hypothetical protein